MNSYVPQMRNPVYIDEASLELFSTLTPDQARHSMLAAMQHWNEHSEGGYFDYMGHSSVVLPEVACPPSQCGEVNTVRVEDCDTGMALGVLEPKCKCGSALRWNIRICASFGGVPHGWQSPDAEGSSLYTLMVHELGHALGLHHPSGQDAQSCVGDATVMGFAACSGPPPAPSSVGPYGAHSLYRNDRVCSLKSIGAPRELQVVRGLESQNQLSAVSLPSTFNSANFSPFESSFPSDSGYASAFGTGSSDTALAVEWRSLAGTVLGSFNESSTRRGMVTPLTLLYPEESGPLRRRFVSGYSPGASNDWHQMNRATVRISTDNFASHQYLYLRHCTGTTSCGTLQYLETLHSLRAQYFPALDRTLVLWVHRDRSRFPHDATYLPDGEIRMAFAREGHVSHLDAPIPLVNQLRSISAPGFVCHENSWCIVFFVPRTDPYLRLHMSTILFWHPNGWANLPPVPVTTNSGQTYHHTASDIVAWVRDQGGSNQTVYVAFMEHAPRFRVRVLSGNPGAANMANRGHMGPGIASLAATGNTGDDWATMFKWLRHPQ